MSKKKTPYELMMDDLKRWVGQGAPEQICRDLLNNESRYSDPLNARLAMEYLQKALDAAADAGPERLVELGYGEMLRFTTGALLRAQIKAERWVREWGSSGDMQLVQSMNTEVMPIIERLHNHVVHLIKGYGTAKHVLDLAKRPDDHELAAKVLKLVDKSRAIAQQAEAVIPPDGKSRVA